MGTQIAKLQRHGQTDVVADVQGQHVVICPRICSKRAPHRSRWLHGRLLQQTRRHAHRQHRKSKRHGARQLAAHLRGCTPGQQRIMALRCKKHALAERQAAMLKQSTLIFSWSTQLWIPDLMYVMHVYGVGFACSFLSFTLTIHSEVEEISLRSEVPWME